jgi:hypothetical protein
VAEVTGEWQLDNAIGTQLTGRCWAAHLGPAGQKRGGSSWASGGFQPIWLREENFLFYKSFFIINRNQFEFKIN